MTNTQQTAPTISVHIDRNDALALIALAGGTPGKRGGWDINGIRYWETDEALTVALGEIAASDLGR